MKIKTNEINNFLKNLEPFKNPILLYGPNDGLVMHRTKKIIQSFLGKTLNLNQINTLDYKKKKVFLSETLNTHSLFSKKEVIKIINADDKIIEELSNDSIHYSNEVLVLINTGELFPKSKLRTFFENEKNSIIIPCYNTDISQLKDSIREFANENNLKIEGEALSYLVNNLGNNYQIIYNELEKLILLGDRIISYDLIKKLITSNAVIVHEDIILCCLNGEKDFINDVFLTGIRDVNDASSIISSMRSFLIIIASALGDYKGNNLEYVVENYLPKYLFKKRVIFTNIVKKISKNKVLTSINILSEMEKKIRQNQSLYKPILLRGLINIAQNMN